MWMYVRGVKRVDGERERWLSWMVWWFFSWFWFEELESLYDGLDYRFPRMFIYFLHTQIRWAYDPWWRSICETGRWQASYGDQSAGKELYTVVPKSSYVQLVMQHELVFGLGLISDLKHHTIPYHTTINDLTFYSIHHPLSHHPTSTSSPPTLAHIIRHLSSHLRPTGSFLSTCHLSPDPGRFHSTNHFHDSRPLTSPSLAPYPSHSVPSVINSITKMINEQSMNSPFTPLNPSTSSPKPDRTQTSFYQRRLPEGCIPFTSEPGKKLFREALDTGYLDAFFPLSSQLVTQHEPSFCGLASLCTVLNALGVDPRRVWKYPWRWYEQDMLDCCRPLEAVQQVGITLSEFNCLSRCNGLTLRTASPSAPDSDLVGQTASTGLSLDDFRREVEAATSTSSSFMVVSFSRAVLGQTGSGHFSPIAGYAPSVGRVLVLDVARFKYPSYWVTLEDLYNAMRPIDPATGLPRGFTVLSSAGPSIDTASRSTTTLALNKSSWAVVSRRLREVVKPELSFTDATAILVQMLSVLQEVCSTGAVEIRSGMEGEAKRLTEVVWNSSLGKALTEGGHVTKGLDIFLILALFGGRASSISQSLLQSDSRQVVERLVTSVLNDELSLVVHQELDVLAQQVSALGECCAIEGGQVQVSGQPNACACARTPNQQKTS